MKSAKEILTGHEKFHITLGIERIEKILDILSNPQDKYKIIHIAGTNGKGSTSKIINDILINSNKKTGLFTSPHLFNYEERIKVNNENISEYVFNKLINDIDELAKKNNIELSEFELLTAVALYYFFLKGVDFAVLETGLGGLYDATNVVKDSLSVITTIDFDHKERLGNTIEDIAIQKGGIIKKDSNVVISKDNLGFNVIKDIAKEKNANVIESAKIELSEKNKIEYKNKVYDFNLSGAFQLQNLSLALGAIEFLNNKYDLKIDEKILEKSLKNVTWDFRNQYFKKQNILIDSAHNPSGVRVLRDVLNSDYKEKNKIFIFGCLKNKDYVEMINIINDAVNDNDNDNDSGDEFYFYEFNYPNALSYEEFTKNTKLKIPSKKLTELSQIKDIIKKDDLKVFFGSIYMLGSIFSEIKLK